jgi:HEPN domain-containing protein
MRRQTAQWLRKAEADHKSARKNALLRPPHKDLVCFLCQQAAEKYFKALLQELSVRIPRTHDLRALLQLILPHHPTLHRLNRGLLSLSRFAVDYRYPGANATARQMQSALRCMERVRKLLRRTLGLRV